MSQGSELGRLPREREGWMAGVGMTPGHTEEGVRLRESLPLPNTSQMFSLRASSSPHQAPRGTVEKVKYYIKQTFASYSFQHVWVIKMLV